MRWRCVVYIITKDGRRIRYCTVMSEKFMTKEEVLRHLDEVSLLIPLLIDKETLRNLKDYDLEIEKIPDEVRK